MPKDLQQVMSELIKKQMLILGPNVALSRTRNVKALTVDDSGVVTNISGDPQAALSSLVAEFEAISGAITKNLLQSLL